MDQNLVKLARNVLAAGKKILVLGVTEGNLGKWHKVQEEDKRLVFWFTDDSKKKNPPADVGLVLVTRFVDHHLMERVARELSPLALFHHQHMQTGQLKALLNESYSPPVKKIPQGDALPVNRQTVRNQGGAIMAGAAVATLNGAGSDLRAELAKGLEVIRLAAERVLGENNTLQEQVRRQEQQLAAAKDAATQATASDELLAKLKTDLEEQVILVGLEREAKVVAESRATQLEAQLREEKERADRLQAQINEYQETAEKLATFFLKKK